MPLRPLQRRRDARQHPRRAATAIGAAWCASSAHGVACFALAYAGLAFTTQSIVLLGVGFVVAGIGIGLVETAEHAAVATFAADEIRGSAFGLLAAIQSFGNLAASAIVGLLYTLVSPSFAFGYAAAIMVAALDVFRRIRLRRNGHPLG